MRLAPPPAMLLRLAVLVICLSALATPVAQAQSTPDELNEAGWKSLQSGDGARAGRLFAEALSIEPNDPVLLFGAGAAAHLQGRSKEAAGRLERALEFNPRLTGASLLLGEIVYADGHVTQAITIYEKALKYAPKDADLTRRLESWRADAAVHRDFEERRFDRFRVMFQGRADEPLAAQATETLNSEFWRLGAALGGYPSDPVVVMLYTETQFRDITQAPEWAGGIYDGRIRIPAAGAARRPQAFDRVLVHELTHAMIANMAPRGIPAWLHEGLAQYFEGDDPAAARRRVKASGRMISLRSLEDGFSRLGPDEARVAYDASLVAVNVMLQRPGLNWPSIFRALSENDRPERTLDSFGFPYTVLEAEFRR